MRVTVFAATIYLSVSALAAAQDAKAAIRRQTMIPTEALGTALQTLAKDYDLQVLYRTEVVGELRTRGAAGSLTATEALGEILSGTGLSYRYLDDKTVTIVPVADRSGAATPSSQSSQDAPPAHPQTSESTGGNQNKDLWDRFRLAQTSAGAAASDASVGDEKSDKQHELDEIIVTATRRDVALIDAPVAISAFTEADIERRRITQPADFLAQVSNVNLTNAVRPGEADVSMRGIQGNFGLTQPVAVVVDGVVAANPNALDQELVGIQQIEVVKGPQSALYGRNANAGAIVITTKKPTQETEGTLLVGAGNGDAVKAQAMISGGLGIDRLSGRLALSHDGRSGLWDDPTVGRPSDVYQQRIADGRLVYEATDALSIDLRAKVSGLKEGAQLWDVQVPPFIKIDNNNYFPQFQANNSIPARQTRYDYSVKVDYQMPFAVVTGIASYDDYSSKYFADGAFHTLFPGGPPTIFVTPNVLSEAVPPLLPGYSYAVNDGNAFSMLNEYDKTFELRLTSPSDQRFRWFVGAYYAKSRRTFYGDAREDTGAGVVAEPLGAGLIAGSSNPIISVSEDSINFDTDKAAFGQIQVDLISTLMAEVSLRYDRDEKQNINSIPDVTSPVTGLPLTDPLTAPSGLLRSTTFTKYQPKYTLRYKPLDNLTVFGSYGLGFRPGGFNGAGTGAAVRLQAPDTNYPDAFPAEVAHASELGFKSEWLDRRLLLNGSLFYTKIDDAQAFTAFPNPPITLVISLDEVRSQGVELEASYRLNDHLRISDSFGYTDTKIQRTALATALGKKVPGTPNYTNNLGVDFTHVLYHGFNLVSRLEWNQIGPMWFDVYNSPGTGREAIGLVNARLGVERNDRGMWSVTAWANNLTNKYYNVYAAPVPPIANFSYRAEPRMYGVDVTYKF
jgi:iron complex outermembrane receptor protein